MIDKIKHEILTLIVVSVVLLALLLMAGCKTNDGPIDIKPPMLLKTTPAQPTPEEV